MPFLPGGGDGAAAHPLTLRMRTPFNSRLRGQHARRVLDFGFREELRSAFCPPAGGQVEAELCCSLAVVGELENEWVIPAKR